MRKVIYPGGGTAVGTTIAEVGSGTITLEQLAAAINNILQNAGTITTGSSTAANLVLGPGLAGGGTLVGNVPLRLTAPIPAMWTEDGVEGDMGPPGIIGPRGQQGIPGQFLMPEDGADGDWGPPGAAGATGATGAQGPQGPAGSGTGSGGVGTILMMIPDDHSFDDTLQVPGPTGATGATGAQGPQGPAGTAGASLLMMLPDDHSFDDTLQVPGPTGATGATGAQGPQGPAGSGSSTGGVVFIPEDTSYEDLIAPYFIGSSGKITVGPQGPVGPGLFHDDPNFEEGPQFAIPDTVISFIATNLLAAGGRPPTGVSATFYSSGVGYFNAAVKAPQSPLTSATTQAYTGVSTFRTIASSSISTALTADSLMTITCNEVGRYSLESLFLVNEATIGVGGFDFDFNGGSVVATGNYVSHGLVGGVVFANGARSIVSTTSYGTITTSAVSIDWAMCNGTIQVVTTGTLALRWAQNVALSTAASSLNTGSYLRVLKIG
jgi:hypothetical protein